MLQAHVAAVTFHFIQLSLTTPQSVATVAWRTLLTAQMQATTTAGVRACVQQLFGSHSAAKNNYMCVVVSGVEKASCAHLLFLMSNHLPSLRRLVYQSISQFVSPLLPVLHSSPLLSAPPHSINNESSSLLLLLLLAVHEATL